MTIKAKMRKNHVLRSLNYLALLTIFGLSFLAHGQVRSKVYLDSHLHFYSIDLPLVKDKLKKMVDAKLFKKAFLLSPSHVLMDEGMFARAFGKDRRETDRDTALLVQSFPNVLVGLCGLGDWKDGAQVLSECLARPGMIGVKVRLGEKYQLLNPQEFPLVFEKEFAAIRTALLANRDQLKVVLLHLPLTDSTPSQQQNVVLTELFNLLKDMPTTQIIVAHAFESADTLLQAAKLKKEQGATNLWIDTSDPQESPSGSLESKKSWAQAWTTFGIEQVLFGSDMIAGPFWTYTNGNDVPQRDSDSFSQQVAWIDSNPFLDPTQRHFILYENGRKLFETLP